MIIFVLTLSQTRGTPLPLGALGEKLELIIDLSIIVVVVEGFNFVDKTESIIKGLPSG
jgi:hypothetical protein